MTARHPRLARLLRRAAAWAAALVVVAAAPAVAGPWRDSVPVTVSPLTAATVPAPPGFGCVASLTSGFRFSWTAVPGATGYVFSYTGGTVQLGASTTTYTVSPGMLGVLGKGDASVRARRVFPAATWSSPSSAGIHYTYTLGLLGVLVLANC